MGSRISSHKIETQVKNNVRKIIDNGNFLFRELTERDYGIDAIIECFDEEDITGKLALVQLKGKSKKIVPLKTKPVISCIISTSSAQYAFQKNIPVILIYASLETDNMFYYVFLQDIPDNEILLDGKGTITIHIPIENIVYENANSLIELINKYY